MSVNLSPLGGAGAQFFSNNGVPLAGGLLYTYLAGTSTPATTYTSSSGVTPLANPIILDAAGRVPTGEIWLFDGISYKFVLKDATDALIATWDNLSGINSNFIAFTVLEETATATAGQTVFNLSFDYIPATNNLAVFVNGSNQVVSVNYLETDTNTVTFLTGLNVGDVVKFSTATPVATNAMDAANVSYTPAGVDAVTTNVQAKLRESVSVKDFGAVGDGVADDTAAIEAALAAQPVGVINFPRGTYLVSDQIHVSSLQSLVGEPTGTYILGTNPLQAIFQVGSDPDVDGNIPGTTTQYSPYQPGYIDGIGFLTTDANLALLNANPYSGNIESCAIVMGGGVYGAIVNNLCWLYTVRNCSFRYFKRAITIGCRIQGPSNIENCSFFTNHIAIESMCYHDGGPFTISKCELYNNGHDFKALYEPAYQATGTFPTYNTSFRSVGGHWSDCYFGGVNPTAPGVYVNYTYPNTTIYPTNSLLSRIFSDCYGSYALGSYSMKFSTCSFESGVNVQTRIMDFNKVQSANVSLDIINCEIGYGYEQQFFTTADVSGAAFDIKCGYIAVLDTRLADFGDPNSRFNCVFKISHNSTGGIESVKYRGAEWEVDLRYSSGTSTYSGNPLILLQAARGSTDYWNLEEGATQPALLHVHYQALFGTNIPTRLWAEKQIQFASTGTFNLDVRHFNSQLIICPGQTVSLNLPGLSDATAGQTGGSAEGLYFDIINVSGNVCTLIPAAADTAKIYNTTIANGEICKLWVGPIPGDARWFTSISIL
jgi:hypothetical protein